MSTPSKIEVEARLRIGATKDGRIKALKSRYYVNCGAYSDSGPRMARAIASESSGPYNIENIHCDSLAVYTNHTYTTAYIGGNIAGTIIYRESLLPLMVADADIVIARKELVNRLPLKDVFNKPFFYFICSHTHI